MGINTTGAPGPSQRKIQFQKGLVEFMGEKKKKQTKREG